MQINSRKVLESLLAQLGIKGIEFNKACVIIDKLDKIGPEGVTTQLAEIGVDQATADKILAAMASKTIDELASLVQGVDSESVDELRTLFQYAADYGFAGDAGPLLFVVCWAGGNKTTGGF